MNACEVGQLSCNRWGTLSSAMVHQAQRESRELPRPPQNLEILDALEQQMASFAAEHEARLQEVRKHYVFSSVPSVAGFLTEHRSVPSLLLEAVPALKGCFGEGTIFKLRTLMEESESRTLYAVVMWPGAIGDVREALARFDERWGTALSLQASEYLTFAYELV